MEGEREAQRVADSLARSLGEHPTVWPVIVVIAPKATIKEHPTDVSVVQARELIPWLTSLSRTIERSLLERLRRAVRHESTWDRRLSPPRVIDYVPAHRKGEATEVETPTFEFRPWRRYGKRRIYIKDSAGTHLGYYDEISKEFQLVETAPRDAIVTAAQSFLQTVST